MKCLTANTDAIFEAEVARRERWGGVHSSTESRGGVVKKEKMGLHLES